jgi:SAM-dependent methyltransferase
VSARYDRIGRAYSATRVPDPRIAGAIRRALGDARSVVNVGAGSGAYEPADLEVIAVEPSETMLLHRPTGSGRAVRAVAEALPLRGDSVDAALAIQTVNHWRSLAAGLAEMRRVARRRAVVFMRDPRAGTPLWLTERYLPVLDETALLGGLRAGIERAFQTVRSVVVPLPADCTDGFLSAFWARPEAYLDPTVRANMSPFALAGEERVARGIQRLARDLEDGTWDREHGHLRAQAELDVGHRILVAELDAVAGGLAAVQARHPGRRLP